MTAKEFLVFHGEFKSYLSGVSVNDILTIVGLEKAANKQIRYYSSGMKQRVKLAQAIFTNTPLLLLDEPCTNLDVTGYELYHHLIENYCKEKTIIVSSNDENEYSFCSEKINVADYK
jgi:ABC-type multidrug transport system ATPase subunit